MDVCQGTLKTKKSSAVEVTAETTNEVRLDAADAESPAVSLPALSGRLP